MFCFASSDLSLSSLEMYMLTCRYVFHQLASSLNSSRQSNNIEDSDEREEEEEEEEKGVVTPRAPIIHD